MQSHIYAVITGDVVNFTRISEADQQKLLHALKSSFDVIRGYSEQQSRVAFDLFRGDSFQGVIPDPRKALQAALTHRAALRSVQPEGTDILWDVRTAIGIGRIKTLPKRPTEGDGEAFRQSGPALDQLKGRRRLAILSPWEKVDEELDVAAALLDAVIAKWSPKQAEAVVELMQGKSQTEIAANHNISQSAVSYRVNGAGWFAVRRLLRRYSSLIDRQLAGVEE